MVRVRVVDTRTNKEYSKFFINEFCAKKYVHKSRYFKNIKVVGELEFVKNADLQPKK